MRSDTRSGNESGRARSGATALRIGKGLALALGVILAAACSGDLGQDQTDVVPLVSFTRQWSIGGPNDIAGEPIVRPVGAAEINDSLFVFIDASVPRGVLIDSRGQIVRVFSREGAGPGELVRPENVGVNHDTIWVSDVTGRVTWFNVDGEYERSVEYREQLIPGTPWFYQYGSILENGSMLARVVTRSGMLSDSAVSVPLVIQSGDRQKIVRLFDGVAPATSPMRMSSTGVVLHVNQVIPAQPIVGASVDGDWVFVLERKPAEGTHGEMRLHRFNPDGEELATLRLAYSPIPVQKYVADSIRARFDRANAHQPGAWDFQHVYNQYWIPQALPPVSQVVADSSGFWLRRELFQAPTVWERYDLNGMLQFRAHLPVAFEGLTGRRHYILGVERDSMMLPFLSFYASGEGE